ncbi:oxidoreductase, short chain dehydrogenase/reductase family protein [Leptospira ryugenii]|uniref:Oxidoreductase, short chain dehydrogenase/reductase family protein n=1 Tax=Leptospira ryugenii TaxID=1917863 RepID=A0A2P2DZE5_9LEPT|nr:SDR family oxidoreductase [Leptospira ryugenii]GBF49995.1 oxidoreductase, short chain dehydrogenase/reductase family protein [Leptospira ryugenii]
MNQNQWICITGCTDGIGRISALELAKKGYPLVLVARNSQKLENLKKELLQIRNEPDAFVLFVCDLSILSNVRSTSQEILNRFPKLYCLLNNAGAFFQERTLSAEGKEMTYALNHLHYFLLTNSLLPALQAFGKARIVNVASRAHKGVELDFQNIEGERLYSGWKQYQRSKLMNIYFTYHLAERLKGTSVTANCLHPGFVKTKFGWNNEGLAKLLVTWGQNLLAISEEEGAKTSVYLASSAEVDGITGKYFVKCKPERSSKVSYDSAIAKELWEHSEKTLKAILA